VPGGRSARQGLTVRGHRADGLRPSSGQSVKHTSTTRHTPRNADRPYLTRGLSESNSCRVDGPWPPGGQSAKPLQARNSWPNGSKIERSRTSEEHEEHLDELHLADGPPATRERSARNGNSSPSLKPKEPNYLPVHGSPKRQKLLFIWGRSEASLGDAMPQNLDPQMN
jgi:hypothetical protein